MPTLFYILGILSYFQLLAVAEPGPSKDPLVERALDDGLKQIEEKFPQLSNAPQKEEKAVSPARTPKSGRSPAFLQDSLREVEPGGTAQ